MGHGGDAESSKEMGYLSVPYDKDTRPGFGDNNGDCKGC